MRSNHALVPHLLCPVNPLPARLYYLNFHPLEVVSATATHNFKWVKITRICLIRDQIFANLDV